MFVKQTAPLAFGTVDGQPAVSVMCSPYGFDYRKEPHICV